MRLHNYYVADTIIFICIPVLFYFFLTYSLQIELLLFYYGNFKTYILKDVW